MKRDLTTAQKAFLFDVLRDRLEQVDKFYDDRIQAGAIEKAYCQREAAIEALAVITSPELELGWYSRSLRTLEWILVDLHSTNVVRGALKPLSQKGGNLSPLSANVIQGKAAAYVKQLTEVEPETTFDQALKWMENLLHRSGYRIGRKNNRRATTRTIREWYERYHGPLGDKGNAKVALEDSKSVFARAVELNIPVTRIDLERAILDCLAILPVDL